MRRTTTRLAIALAALAPLVIGTAVAAGPSGGAQHPSLIEPIQIAGRFGIPDDAAMIAANVTAVSPDDNGFITVWPCDEDRPETSNVNYLEGQVAPNFVMSKLSADGLVCISTRAVSDVIIDLAGYVPAGSNVTPLAQPVRFIDTRDEGGPVSAGTSLRVPIAGVEGIPGDADLVMFNATAIAGSDPGYLSAYPCGEPVPDTSSVNYLPGQIVPNFVTSRIGTDGSVCLFTLADADIIVDVAAHAGAGIEPLDNPIRLVDTREGRGPQPADGVLRLYVPGHPAAPPELTAATAVVYNLTSVNSTEPGFATSYPCDVDLPDVSNLNYGPGQVVANGAITKVSGSLELCIYTLTPTDLIVDLTGFTRGTADYVPIEPVRIRDTRKGWRRSCDWVVVPAVDDATVRLSDALAVNLATGATRRMPLAPGHHFLPSIVEWYPVMNATCDGVIYLADDTLHEMFFDGRRTSTTVPFDRAPDDVPSINPPGSIESLDDGRTVMVHNEVIDLSTGKPVGPGVANIVEFGGESWYRADGSIADDGGVLAGLYDDGTASRSIVRTSNANGVEIASWPIDLVGRTLDVSPDGRYVVVSTFAEAGLPTEEPGTPGAELDTPGATLIFTVFGDLVDLAAGYEVNPDASFTGRGELAVCVGSLGLFVFELFGPIELVVPERGPFGDENPFCAIGT